MTVRFNNKCLESLLDHEEEIGQHFPDGFVDVCELSHFSEANNLLIETCKRYFSIDEIQSKYPGDELEDKVQDLIELLGEREYYAEAFGFGTLCYQRSFAFVLDYFDSLAKIRDKIICDVGKYEEKFKLFEPILKKYFPEFELNKSAFYYLELIFIVLHIFCITDSTERGPFDLFSFCEIEENFDEILDLKLSFARKRFDLEFFPRGKTNYIYNIIVLSLYNLLHLRFKQARHLIAVAEEFMKTVNQDTQNFKKLLDMFYMAKTIYLVTILNFSKFYEEQKCPHTLFCIASKPKDEVIDFGIALPDGEDPELPVELVKDSANRKEIYKKLHKYKKELEKSSLPHISEIYNKILETNFNLTESNDDKDNTEDSCKVQ